MYDVRKSVAAACLLALFLTCSTFGLGSAPAAEPPRSTSTSRMSPSTSARASSAGRRDCDNFHLTWHSDDALYGAYGDGWGFARTDIAKRAIGISRITGEPPDLRGLEMWEGSAQGGRGCWAPWNGKSWGMLSTGLDLHKWFTIGRPRALGFTEARLATSSDGGRSWRRADWAFTAADGVLMPSFLQLGRGYDPSGLPAENIELRLRLSQPAGGQPGQRADPGQIDVIRAPKDRIAEDERPTSSTRAQGATGNRSGPRTSARASRCWSCRTCWTPRRPWCGTRICGGSS